MSNKFKFAAGVPAPSDAGFPGVSLITSEVEALGHGVWVDAFAVGQALDLLKGKKLPSYVTHNGAGWGERLGSEAGFIEDFRIEDGKLRGNFVWYEAFKEAHPAIYGIIREMGEKTPELVALSIVFGGSLVWVLADGSEVEFSKQRPEGAMELPRVRFSSVESADFVSKPAANPTGLFGQDAFAKLQSEHAKLQGELSALTSERDTLKGELSAAHSRIGELDTELKEAKRYDIRKAAPHVQFHVPESFDGSKPLSILEQYEALNGKERSEFFARHKEEIWAEKTNKK